MTQTADSKRVKRLVELCKLWGAVKVFHPYLAYREDIDWDAALITAIPKVSAARDVNAYAVAVSEMLAALNDPLTRVIEKESGDYVSPPHECQPSYTLTPDQILVVSIHYYEDTLDFVSTMAKMQAIKVEIPKARGVLFDLRAAAPDSREKGNLPLIFQLSDIAAALSTTPLITAGQRTRMYQGYVPQIRSMGSPLYHSAFQVVDGSRISPAPDALDLPIVFLINAWSELPPEALALQIAEKAVIFVEGCANEAALNVKTHLFPLDDGTIAQIRLGELINQDGSGGFTPDQIIEPPPNPGEQDPALKAALKLLRNFKLDVPQRGPLPVYAAPLPDNMYPEMTLPPLEYRLLAAFRIWAVIHYFFPYKDLIEEDWDDVLREFILKMEQADSALDYHLTVAEMVTHIHDSHAGVYSLLLQEQLPYQFGPAVPPVGLQIIEDVPVITASFDEEITQKAGVYLGDILLKTDGEDAMKRINEYTRYRSDSTSHGGLHRAALNSLSGPEESTITLTLRDRDGQIKEVQLPRKSAYESWGRPGISQRGGEVVKLLSDEIGYADLDRLEVSEVDAMFETFKHTKAIIFDMRGFPQFTMWAIAPRLAAEDRCPAALYQPPLVMAPEYPGDDITSRSIKPAYFQPIPPTEKWFYQGKTVMLIDERAISQPEHAGLFFEAANGTKFVGSPTAGADGDISNFTVPGGIIIGFTAQAVKHADGRQLQRNGLVPDVEVRPTIEGIQNGKDEVLEAALEYLQREITFFDDV